MSGMILRADEMSAEYPTDFEFRPGATGFGVDSIVHKNGRRYVNQVFWHENEEVARAFFNGIRVGLGQCATSPSQNS